MEPSEILKIASMVKTSILASIRSELKEEKPIYKILDKYEYATFNFDKDGNFILIHSKKRF